MPTEEIWVVDRFEGDVAVLVSEDVGETVEVPRGQLSEGARAGDVLRVQRDAAGGLGWARAVVDEEATARRLDEARAILKELRARDPGGDVAL